MEKGANNSSGFCVSDKKLSFPSDDICLLKLQGTQPSFPSKICMMGFHEKSNLNHFSESVSDDGGGGGRSTCGGGLWPTDCGGASEVVANIYLHNVSTSGGCAEKLTSTSTLQPFEVFPYCSTTRSKSTVGMAASVGFPFTFAQWKELERQAMIYKYMIASVPVPADLLFPLSRNFSDSSLTLAGGSDGIYMARCSKKGDPEPGRCKRTDGKKWRCSRDVAPQQKYCERHLHRGRPRSRKPVEAKSNTENQKKARLEQSPIPVSSDASQQFAAAAAYQPHLLYNPRSDLKASTPLSEGDNRDMGLMMQSGMATLEGSQLPLQHLMEAHIGVTNESSPVYSFHQDIPEQQLLNLLPYSNFPASEIEAPSRFIDDWSTVNLNGDQRNRSPSFNLPVEMGADDVMDQERRKVVSGSGDLKDFDGHKANDDSGNSSPVSWEPFARGGPLAEALQLGSVAIGGSNPASPYRSINTPATTTSSPSGVNHRTMFSDSSVCNSPTLAAPHSEVAFQWLN